jgi:hypothetical protein
VPVDRRGPWAVVTHPDMTSRTLSPGVLGPAFCRCAAGRGNAVGARPQSQPSRTTDQPVARAAPYRPAALPGEDECVRCLATW